MIREYDGGPHLVIARPLDPDRPVLVSTFYLEQQNARRGMRQLIETGLYGTVYCCKILAWTEQDTANPHPFGAEGWSRA